VRLSYNLDTRVFENLAHKPARQSSGVIAVSRYRSQELFGRDEESARAIGGAGGVGPGIAGKEDGKPEYGVGKDPPHRFGVP